MEKQLQIPFPNQDFGYEECIVCGVQTNVHKTTHIDYRVGYIEGAGQLCYGCYTQTSRNLITVDERTILDTPNNLELGAKVRKIYWETKNK